MGQLFILLLRIMFPFDKFGRSRELMRGWLQMVMGWVADPEDVEDFADWADGRAKLEGHICALENAMQILVWERAREMLGLPFIYVRRQSNPKLRVAKDMRQLFRRLTQVARNFHNLDKLAARRAESMKREHDADPLSLRDSPLRLAASLQSTSPARCAVEDSVSLLEVLPRRRRGRWIGASSRRDGGGCAFPRGSAFARGPPPLPNPRPQLPRRFHLRDRTPMPHAGAHPAAWTFPFDSGLSPPHLGPPPKRDKRRIWLARLSRFSAVLASWAGMSSAPCVVRAGAFALRPAAPTSPVT